MERHKTLGQVASAVYAFTWFENLISLRTLTPSNGLSNACTPVLPRGHHNQLPTVVLAFHPKSP